MVHTVQSEAARRTLFLTLIIHVSWEATHLPIMLGSMFEVSLYKAAMTAELDQSGT